MMCNQHTDLYVLLGMPTGHSLSPAIHNAAFSQAGINAVYVACETQDISGSIQGIRALGIKGASLTMPFKQEVLPFLDQLDPVAREVGSVNTIVNKGGYLTGCNTDAFGALTALREKVDPTGKECVIVGAGGAARAMGVMLKERGAAITVVNRSQDRGRALARFLQCPFVPLEGLSELHGDIIIQTTPVGMHPHEGNSPIPEHLLKRGMAIMDMVYNPRNTEFILRAAACGCTTITGDTMFLHQAAEQFRLWTGRKAPINAMRLAFEKALSQENEAH